MQSQRELKCLMVGEALEIEGKSIPHTALLKKYETHTDLTKMGYIPTAFDALSVHLDVHNISVKATFDVMTGAEDYSRLRLLYYVNKHVFILPFSYENHSNLETIQNKWVPELRHYAANALIYLVGIHSTTKEESVSPKEVEELAKKMHVFHYDCESSGHAAISRIFDRIVTDAVGQRYAQPKVEHKQNKLKLFPFFRNNFISQQAGLEFAKKVAWISRGHWQENCILHKLPLEILLSILCEAALSILKDPANKENQTMLEVLCLLVYENASSAKASTGQSMVWNKVFGHQDNNLITVYPIEDDEKEAAMNTQVVKKKNHCRIM